MIAVNGKIVAQGSQFSLNDVEVVTATVDLTTSHGLSVCLKRPSPYSSLFSLISNCFSSEGLFTANTTNSQGDSDADDDSFGTIRNYSKVACYRTSSVVKCSISIDC